MKTSPIYFGLTGGVASGKTTVAGFFKELGARVIEADRIGHELLARGKPAYREALEAFGRAVLDERKEIDRKRLGPLVFSDPAKLARLNAILHPKIIERVEARVKRARREDPRAVVLVDAALIFEAGIGAKFKKVIVAWCRPDQQLERLMQKAQLSEADARRRIGAQMPVVEKRRRADFHIDCSGTLEETRTEVEKLFSELKRLAAER